MTPRAGLPPGPPPTITPARDPRPGAVDRGQSAPYDPALLELLVWTPAQFAQVLGVCTDIVDDLIRDHQAPAKQLSPRKFVIPVAEAKRWLADGARAWLEPPLCTSCRHPVSAA